MFPVTPRKIANMNANSKKLLAEVFGTFALVFAGTGAIVINNASGGMITHVGVALTFGLIVMAMVFAIGDVSGAHLNPAVTVAFWLARRHPGNEIVPYILAQLLGAFAASSLLKVLFTEHPTLGATLPAGSFLQSWILECVLTWLLMFVVLCVSTGAREKGITAAIAVGGVIALEALFAGPICGASMNPARSFAPAVMSGNLYGLWIYLTAPFVGSLLAVPSCGLIQPRGCCGADAMCNPSESEVRQ